MSTHGLAELFSAITNHPREAISPAEALRATELLQTTLTPISLSVNDYFQALGRNTALNIPDGGIYDALHAQAALKVEADLLLTFNAKHFTRLGDDVVALIRVP